MSNNKIEEKNYQKLVAEMSPKSSVVINSIKAFFVGGFICLIGQVITRILLNMGYTFDETSMATSIILIFVTTILTGLGIYDNIGKFAGAGSIVPITGFANSMVAPALEFKKEGFIFGVGAKMFLIAGPVIVYSTITSVIVGVIYYFVK